MLIQCYLKPQTLLPRLYLMSGLQLKCSHYGSKNSLSLSSFENKNDVIKIFLNKYIHKISFLAGKSNYASVKAVHNVSDSKRENFKFKYQN